MNEVKQRFKKLEKVSEKIKLDDEPYFETHTRPTGIEFEYRKSLDSIPPEYLIAALEGI